MNKENMKMEILDLNNEEDTKTTDEMEPKKPEAITDTFAGPPLVWPAKASAKSLNSCPMPDLLITAPKRIKRKM